VSELPPTWAEVPFSAITVDASQRVPLADEVIRYIDIGSVNRNTKSVESPQELLGKDAPSRARKQVAVGDTLVSMTRPNLNAVALVPKELDGQIASTGFDVLRPVAGVDPRWIGYLVRTEAFVEAMSDLVQGALYPAVRSKDVRAHVVPLAPQVEQTRIANQLDTLLTRVQACNDRFDAIPALLKRFRQTVLDAAVSGSLSEDWRLNADQSDAGASPGSVVTDLPEGWRWSCSEEIKAGDRHALAIGPFGSSLKVSDYKSEGVPLVFVREIRSRNFSSGSTKFVSVHKAQELKAHSIQGGDLLITKMGDPPGDVAIYPEGAPLAIITADCVRLRVDNTIAVAAFVGYTIVCTDTRERLRDITAGVAQRKISLSRFRHFALPLAPLKEQAEIIRRVEALFALADRIEARCTTARTQAQRLTPLVLAKAFRGELVPQDPNDEPANALLARIASSNSAVPGKNKREMPAALKNRAQEAINL
jgi:type I restriction enzyme S subunit